MFEFNEIEWANRAFRGKEFGGRGKTYVYLQGRGPHVIHCRTGNKPEQMIRLGTGSSIPGMGPQIEPVFSTDPEGKGEPLAFNSLFLSDDGTDQWPPKDFYTGVPQPRGPEFSLKPDTDYYFYLPAVVGGHESWEPQIRFGYASTMSDDVETLSPKGIPLSLNNVPGMWYPDQ